MNQLLNKKAKVTIEIENVQRWEFDGLIYKVEKMDLLDHIWEIIKITAPAELGPQEIKIVIKQIRY